MQHPLKMGVQILRLLDTVHQRHREHIGDYLTASEQSDRIIPFNVSQCRDKQVPHQQADKRIMRAVVARKPAYPLGDRQTDPLYCPSNKHLTLSPYSAQGTLISPDVYHPA